jgi:hypothetical protein
MWPSCPLEVAILFREVATLLGGTSLPAAASIWRLAKWGVVRAGGPASVKLEGATSCRDLETAIFLGDYAKVAIAPCFSEVGSAELATHRAGLRMTNGEGMEVAKKLAAASE